MLNLYRQIVGIYFDQRSFNQNYVCYITQNSRKKVIGKYKTLDDAEAALSNFLGPKSVVEIPKKSQVLQIQSIMEEIRA